MTDDHVNLVVQHLCETFALGAPIERQRSTSILSRVLRLGPRRLFARPGCLVVDRDTRRTQPGQQYSSYRGSIESNILGVWWMCLAALQSERQVQLLAKVLNDEIDLIVSHDLLFLLPFCYPTR